MITTDGMAVPVLGTAGGSGMGLGGGVAAAGLGGLLVGALLGGNRGGLFGGGYNNGSPAADAAAASVVLNPAFQSLQQQISGINSTLNTGDIQDSIARNQADIANVATALAAGNFTTLNSINGLGRDLVANIHQQDLQQLNSFNNLTTTTLQGFNSSAMQIQNSTNQIIAQGTANAAAVAAGFCEISKEMATCCCEIKQAIKDDGATTRALINDLNVQSLRDQLAAANNEVSNNKQNQYLLSTILAHYPPIAAPVAAAR